jgi:mRNA interferase MazF
MSSSASNGEVTAARAAALIASAQSSVFRPEVVIAGRDTKVLIDQIRTIDVSYVTGELVDYLSRDDMAQVEHGLSRYFGLPR